MAHPEADAQAEDERDRGQDHDEPRYLRRPPGRPQPAAGAIIAQLEHVVR